MLQGGYNLLVPHTDIDFRSSYSRMLKYLASIHPWDTAMSLAMGGDYAAVGAIEAELLKRFGLKANDFLVDVGCGSGRLATALATFFHGRYLGIDVVPEMLEYAASGVKRPDWQFILGEGLKIPTADGVADMVCFFSVFTHLFHQESYVYLQDAFRALKPGGKVVFSFEEFAQPRHWRTFAELIRRIGETDGAGYNHDQFISRDGIGAWAAHIGFEVCEYIDAFVDSVALPYPVKFDDGRVVSGMAALEQTVCVLRKPA